MISSIFKLPSTDRIKSDTQKCMMELGVQANTVGIPAPPLTM